MFAIGLLAVMVGFANGTTDADCDWNFVSDTATDDRVDRIVERRLEFLRKFPIESGAAGFPTREAILEVCGRDPEFAELRRARDRFDETLATDRAREARYRNVFETISKSIATVDAGSTERPFVRWWAHRKAVWTLLRSKYAYQAFMGIVLVGRYKGAQPRTDEVLGDFAKIYGAMADQYAELSTLHERNRREHFGDVDEIVDRIHHELCFSRE